MKNIKKDKKFEYELIYLMTEHNYKIGLFDRYDIFLLVNELLEMTRKVYKDNGIR